MILQVAKTVHPTRNQKYRQICIKEAKRSMVTSFRNDGLKLWTDHFSSHCFGIFNFETTDFPSFCV